MELPQFGQPQNQNDYSYGPEPPSRRKLLFMIGGVVVLIVALILVFTSGGNKAGQEPMQTSLQATSDALGVVDAYEREIQFARTKNDIALVQILLRGNFQKLNDLYNTTYKPRKKFTPTPKPDEASKATLDRAVRNNTLDSEIIKVLEPKITEAEKNLKLTKPSFTKQDSVEKIQTSITDLGSIQTILNRDR